MTRPWERSRDLDRGEEEFRDTRLIAVACDDTYAPKQYFDFFRIPRIHVKVLPAEDRLSHATHVLERLRSFRDEGDFAKDDEFWLLLDTDHCLEGNHKASFIQALRDARREGFHVALSKPCFEFWLLLHHLRGDQAPVDCNAKAVDALLNEVLHGQYNKKKLKKHHWDAKGVAHAFQEAYAIDAELNNRFDPERNCSQVHELWASILRSSNRSHLSAVLRGLIV